MGHLSKILVLERVKGHLRRNLGDLLFQFTEEENILFEVFGRNGKCVKEKSLGEGKETFSKKMMGWLNLKLH